MKVYRVTRRVERVHYGHYEVGALSTKIRSKRSLSALLKSEAAYANSPMRTVKIEEAEVGEWADVTEAYL